MKKAMILFIVLTSCKATYTRYTDIAHSGYNISLTIKNKSSVTVKTSERKNSDTTLHYTLYQNLQTDSTKKECLIFLENNKVIYSDKSYWIKNGSYNATTEKYVNKDLKF